MSLDTFFSKKFYPVLAANVLKPVDIREKNMRQGVAPQDTQDVHSLVTAVQNPVTKTNKPKQQEVSHPLEKSNPRCNKKLVTTEVQLVTNEVQTKS